MSRRLLQELINEMLLREAYEFDPQTGDWVDPLQASKELKVNIQRSVNKLSQESEKLISNPEYFVYQNRFATHRDSFLISLTRAIKNGMLDPTVLDIATAALNDLASVGPSKQSISSLMKIADMVKSVNIATRTPQERIRAIKRASMEDGPGTGSNVTFTDNEPTRSDRRLGM
jgi:hypothetical protein